MKFAKYIDIGPLRIGLTILVLTLIGMAPFASEASFSGWGVIVGTVAPSLTIIMLFVLPLDMMMSGIFMTDTEGAKRLRYWRILALELILIIALVLAWKPFAANLIS